MIELERLCRQYSSLRDQDIAILKNVEKQLPLIADMANADLFIDIPLQKDVALVIAQARPQSGSSVYEKEIVGEFAYATDEPAVFHALELGVPVCDIRAVTQEQQTVRQNTAPIRNEDGNVIAVLIREKDISQERKLEELARLQDQRGNEFRLRQDDYETDVLREMHHRVKNSLQLVASILNLQARKAVDPETKATLNESVNRVLSIASVHDIVTIGLYGGQGSVSSTALLERLKNDLMQLITPEKDISLVVDAEDVPLSAEKAGSVALVINELVINALRHAFSGRAKGRVVITFAGGTLFHTVSVCDDGIGYDPETTDNTGLGMRIIRTTVQEKLKGKLHVHSGAQGTKVSFDFKS